MEHDLYGFNNCSRDPMQIIAMKILSLIVVIPLRDVIRIQGLGTVVRSKM